MDGNGRWAQRRDLPRSEGHRAGARAVSRTVEAAARLGIGTLTLYAFSCDNWKRPRREVEALMRLFRKSLKEETRRCLRNGIRVRIIGRRDRLSPPLLRAIERCEAATLAGTRMTLRLAIDYSARDTLARAAARTESPTPDAFARSLSNVLDPGFKVPDVDLLVRTSGEQRLSDFLLWECAYAELLFLDTPWPDFTASHLAAALDELARRERRFGALPSHRPAPHPVEAETHAQTASAAPARPLAKEARL